MSAEKKYPKRSRKRRRDWRQRELPATPDRNRDLQLGSNHINSSGQPTDYPAQDLFNSTRTDQTIRQEADSYDDMDVAQFQPQQHSLENVVVRGQRGKQPRNGYEPHEHDCSKDRSPSGKDMSTLPVDIESQSSSLCKRQRTTGEWSNSRKRPRHEPIENMSDAGRTVSPGRRIDSRMHASAEYRKKQAKVACYERLECTFNYRLSEESQSAVATSVKNRKRKVKFSVATCHTYGVQLKRGDKLVLWIDPDCQGTDGKYLARRSRLTKCSSLAADEMRSYLTGLTDLNPHSQPDLSIHPMQRISECPGPWEFIINQDELETDIILGVTNVVDAVSTSSARKQRKSFSEFFHNISVRPFLTSTMLGAVRGAFEKLQNQQTLSTCPTCNVQSTTVVESIDRKLVDASMSLCHAVSRWCPHLILSLLPLIKLHIDCQSPVCDQKLLFQLLEQSAHSSKHEKINFHWSQLPLLLTTEEIKRSANEVSGHAPLPCVHEARAYPDIDAYLNTYTILYCEDRFTQLRSTLGSLFKRTTKPDELGAYVLPDIRVLGVEELRKYPGLAVIMGVERTFAVQKGHDKTESEPLWYRELKYGDLVAYVLNGDFDHILYSTVVSRFHTWLKYNVCQFCFSVSFLTEEDDECNSVDILNSMIQTRNILAVLCPTYYNEFRSVLEAVQERNPDTLPFKEELVSCLFECEDHTTTTGTDVAATEAQMQAHMPSTTESLRTFHDSEYPAMMVSTNVPTDEHTDEVETVVQKVKDSTTSSDCAAVRSNDGHLVPSSPGKAGMTFSPDRAFRRIRNSRFYRSDKYKQTYLPSFIQPGVTCMDWSVIFNKELKNSHLSAKDLQSVNFEVFRQLFKSDLDESQLNAVELALHNRVTVIQGPPGTGKTFIGYKLVELLLSVSTLPKGPIVVLACKNHILNEFLKGCGKFCKPESREVVRVGGKKQDVMGNVAHLSELCRPSFWDGDHPAGKWKNICDVVPAVIEHLPSGMLWGIVAQNQNVEFPQFLADKLVALLSELKHLSEDDVKSLLLETAAMMPDIYRTEHPLYDILEKDVQTRDIDHSHHCNWEDYLIDKVPNSIVSAYVIRSIAVQMKYWYHNDQSIHYLLAEQSGHINNPVDEFYSELKAAFVNYKYKPVDEDDLVDRQTRTTEHQLHADDQQKKGIAKGHFYFSAKQTTKDVSEFWLTADLTQLPSSQLSQERLQEKLTRCCMSRELSRKAKLDFIQTLLVLHRKKHVESLKQELTDISEILLEIEESNRTEERETLKRAKVIGMTMTGVAINRLLTDCIKPSVVIIEEAGEVLETQVIAALSPSVQHLIMIGDHKQLRPKVSCYKLSKENNFNISLLERLIINGHHKVTLTHQGRMLKQFVPLLSCVYDSLETNSDAVKFNKPTSCLAESMFFWTHESAEVKVGFSFSNDLEAEMLVSTVLWCILQSPGYQVRPSQVTVIAMYAAQVELIRKKFRAFHKDNELLVNSLLTPPVNSQKRLNGQERQKHPSGHFSSFISVYSVDQYQGDENDFVFVSLVRSNKDRNMGHVGNINRMCVSCSRGRSGLYLFGNSGFIEQNGGPHWKHVVNCFRKREAVGQCFPVQCPRHYDNPPIAISHWKEFQLDEIQGCLWQPTLCQRLCDQPMPCGQHNCNQKCHPHFGTERCLVTVSKELRCSHSLACPCWQSVKDLKCEEECKSRLSCGKHPCPRKCGQKCPSECERCQVLKMERLKLKLRKEQETIELRKTELAVEIQSLQDSSSEAHLVDVPTGMSATCSGVSSRSKLNHVQACLSKYCEEWSGDDVTHKLEIMECQEVASPALRLRFLKLKNKVLENISQETPKPLLEKIEIMTESQ